MEATSESSFFRSAFGGSEPLGEIFWLYVVVAGIGGLLVLSVGAGLIVAVPYGGFILLAVGLLITSYFGWALVAVWRCAFNVSWRGWGYLARVAAVFIAYQLVISWVTIGRLAYVLIST